MAGHFGLDPFTLPSRISHRQLMRALDHMDRQMSIPDRHDWYSMQVAANVLRSQGAKVTTNDMKIEFERRGKRKAPTMTKEEATQMALARCLARTGGKMTVING